MKPSLHFKKGVICLLDLNYTLVENSPSHESPRLRPFSRQIAGERYRPWLIEALRGTYVILITARPDRYRMETLAHIKEFTGWQPDEAYFAVIPSVPSVIKEHLLKTFIFPKHGEEGARYFGLESNPFTRQMYARYGIVSDRAEDFYRGNP